MTQKHTDMVQQFCLSVHPSYCVSVYHRTVLLPAASFSILAFSHQTLQDVLPFKAAYRNGTAKLKYFGPHNTYNSTGQMSCLHQTELSWPKISILPPFLGRTHNFLNGRLYAQIVPYHLTKFV